MGRRLVLCMALCFSGFACDSGSGPNNQPTTGGSGGKASGNGGSAGGNTARSGGASGGAGPSGGSVTGGVPGQSGSTVATGGASSTGGAAGSPSQGGKTTGGTTGTTGGNTSTAGGSTSTTGGSIGTTGGSTSTGGAGGAATGGSPAGGSTAKPPGPSEIMGWATHGTGTTGGGNATPIVVKSIGELNAAVSGSDPKVIHVSGAIGGTLNLKGSNKTILGINGAKITSAPGISGSNLIIRNIAFTGGTDTISTNGAHHIWIDHCSLADGADGVLDMVGGTDYFTISWTKFYYTRTSAHRFACLVGNQDTATGDKGKLHVTFYKVWWADGVDQRQPRVRFGQVHVLNNLYTSKGNTYAIAPGIHANILAEKNIFIDITEALHSTFYNTTPDAVLEDVGNVFKGTTTGTVGKKGTVPVFTPPYPYTADPPDDALEAAIRAGAGPTLTF